MELPKSIEHHLDRFPDHRKHAEWLIVPPTAEEAVEQFPDLAGSSLAENDRNLIANGVTRLAFYCVVRLSGETHRMAEMLASQQPPGGMTDDVFFSGFGLLGDGMRPAQLESLIQSAKSQGFTPSAHHVYIPQLARFRGDKEAFISRSQGRGYIKRLLEQRGWEADGAVTTTHREPESDPLAPENCKSLGEDIIVDSARDMIKKDPSLKRLTRKELRQKVIDKHGF